MRQSRTKNRQKDTFCFFDRCKKCKKYKVQKVNLKKPKFYLFVKFSDRIPFSKQGNIPVLLKTIKAVY